MIGQRGGWRRSLGRGVVRGSILIVVIWAIGLLGFLAASLASRGVWALELSTRMHQQLETSYIAAGAIERALDMLESDTTPQWDGFSDLWATRRDGFADQVLGAGGFSIVYPHPTPEGKDGEIFGLIDEERFLNLNTAPEAVLNSLLRRTGGLNEDEAMMAAEAIEDWRDKDQEPRPHGAESFYYLGLEDAYESKDGPFENVEELRLVRGMTPDVYERVAPLVTVFGSGQVNINTADEPVLKALGLSPKGIKGLELYRAGNDNTPGTADDRVLESASAMTSQLGSFLPNDDLNLLVRLAQQHVIGTTSEEFRVMITARTDRSEREGHVRCVITRKGQIKAWEER